MTSYRGTYLLLELLVDGVQSVLDGDTLEVAGTDFKAKGEVEVDLLDGGFGEHHLEDGRVCHGVGRGVHLPARG